MKHPDDVLERNVRALLRRSYVPALPAPHFRDRLESLFQAEIARRRPLGPPGSSPALPKRRTSGRPLLFALAAALLALLFGWRFFAGQAAHTPASLVAHGEVALGFPDGSWRAAGDEERAHGLQVAAPVLVVITPERVEFELLVASGRVHLGERSELELVLDGERAAATLRRGSAWFTGDGQRMELPLGVRAPLQILALASVPAAPPADVRVRETREALSSAPAPAAPVDTPSARVFAGHVADAESGQSLRAFSVALLAERRGHQTFPPVRREFEGGEGFFAWADPPSGKQRVFVHAEGYALRALGEFDFSDELPELLVELEPGVRVRGSVLDQDGNPIANALVLSENDVPIDGLLFEHSEYAFWLPIQARSQPDGRFELAHLTPGVHTLRANAAGFALTWEDDVQAPLAPHDELVITLGQGGAIAGRVTRDDGGPGDGVEVVAVAMDLVQRLRQSFTLTRTDAEGRYRFEHLPPMTILVVVMRTGSGNGGERPDVRPVQVIEDETVQVDFLATPRGIRLSGHVRAQDGTPLPHRSLGLFDSETANWSQDWVASTTGADGTYAFEGVRPGRYALYLVDDIGRWLRCLDELELAPQALDVEHDLVVPTARFEVVCRNADGAPVEQSALIVMRLEPDGRETFAGYGQTDAQGRFTFVEQRPGRYYVLAYPQQPGLGFARSELVDVSEDHGPELELLHEAGGAVDVLVRAEDGHALEGATVFFHDETGAEHQFSRVPLTDSAGRYRAPGLCPGRYRVQAGLTGYQGAPVEFRYELGSELEVPVILAPIPLR